MKQRYIPDFLCYDKISPEIKAACLRLGVLVNFGHYPKAEYECIIR